MSTASAGSWFLIGYMAGILVTVLVIAFFCGRSGKCRIDTDEHEEQTRL